MQNKLPSGRGLKPAMPSENLTSDRYDFAFKSLQRLAPSLSSKLVYDIGPGDARMRKRVESLGLHWRGFDIKPWGDVQRWDLSDPCPAPEKAGAVLLLDVIEHTVNPGLGLKNIADAIEPGSYLILSVPNPRWSASRLHTSVFGWPSGFTQLDIDENHHIWTPFPHHLETMLGYAGFVVEDYVTLEGKSRLFKHRLSFARVLIEKLDKSACGMSYAMVARKTAQPGQTAPLYS